MPMLIDGEWKKQRPGTWSKDGRFNRKPTTYRHWVTADGSAGPTGEGGFPAAAGRYHLYVAWACPWAHRTLIMRALKSLESVISYTVVDALMLDDGWTFGVESSESVDTVNGKDFLYEIYQLATPGVTTRVTVPVLWDKERRTIVSNESSEIIRMFNSAFGAFGATAHDYYPEPLRAAIDAVNERVYGAVNNGVYKAGFARSQQAYDEAFDALFDTLDWLEARLAGREWLVGEQMTEADVRLFTTLARFDAVYHGHFKCNRNRLTEFKNLWEFTRRVYRVPGVAETVNMEQIRRHYYGSHRSINPTGIVARGPEFLF